MRFQIDGNEIEGFVLSFNHESEGTSKNTSYPFENIDELQDFLAEEIKHRYVKMAILTNMDKYTIIRDGVEECVEL